MAIGRERCLEAAQALLDLSQNVPGGFQQGERSDATDECKPIVSSHHNRFSLVDFQQSLRSSTQVWRFPRSNPSQSSSHPPFLFTLTKTSSDTQLARREELQESSVSAETPDHQQLHPNRQQHQMGLTKINTGLAKVQQGLKSPFSPTFAKELLQKILTVPQIVETIEVSSADGQSESPTKKRKVPGDDVSIYSNSSISTNGLSFYDISSQVDVHSTKSVSPEIASIFSENPFGANAEFDGEVHQIDDSFQPTMPLVEKSSTAFSMNPAMLKFSSFDEAEESEKTRMRLTIARDDVHYVEANPHHFVAQIVQAFSNAVTSTPSGKTTFDEKEQGAWDHFQEIHVDKVNAYTDQDHDKIERVAWKILRNIVDVHLSSFALPASGAVDTKSKCSDRVVAVAAAISNYGIVRYDMIRLHKVEDLILSPNNYVTRKITNFKNNLMKARRDEINAAECAKRGVSYRQVLGSKSKKRRE